MKTVCLVRHAKSSKDIPNIRDIDRPLNDRGKKDARLIGEMLAEKSFKADILISSPATRALDTAKIIAKSLSNPENKILKKISLYETSLEDYLETIAETENPVHSIALFGHNPLISMALAKLTKKNYQEMKTCAAACIEFRIKAWNEIRDAKGELLFYLSPKDI
jgi:phosphohistidine phosphatase